MTKLIHIDTHAKFDTVQEMDAATNQHINKHRNELNQTDRKVLETIRRYSSIYRAAKIKVATLAELIGKSKITVRRATAKLERLGIIERIKTTRPINVGQGANIYIILPYDDRAEMNPQVESTEPTESKTEEVEIESDPFSFNYNTKDLLHNTYATQGSQTLYQRFKALLSTTTGDTTPASRIYGVYRAQSIKLMRFEYLSNQDKLFEDLAVRALKITTLATRNKKIRNLVGYFSGVLRQLIDKVLFSDAYQDYAEDPDMLLCTH